MDQAAGEAGFQTQDGQARVGQETEQQAIILDGFEVGGFFADVEAVVDLAFPGEEFAIHTKELFEDRDLVLAPEEVGVFGSKRTFEDAGEGDDGVTERSGVAGAGAEGVERRGEGLGGEVVESWIVEGLETTDAAGLFDNTGDDGGAGGGAEGIVEPFTDGFRLRAGVAFGMAEEFEQVDGGQVFDAVDSRIVAAGVARLRDGGFEYTQQPGMALILRRERASAEELHRKSEGHNGVVGTGNEFSQYAATFFSYTEDMSGLIRKLLVGFSFTLAITSAQNIGYGVRGGLPLSDFLKAESKTGALTSVVKGRGNIILGPMFEVRLPFGLGIEADALYRRWDAEGPLSKGTASTWEFPVYGKFKVPGIIVRPYAGAGMNFQRLGDIGKFIGGATVDKSRRGFLGAGGIEVKVPHVRISPEIRVTRWNDAGPLRSTNQIDLLIGLSF